LEESSVSLEVFGNNFPAVRRIAMAPMGAVIRMERTAMVRTFSPFVIMENLSSRSSGSAFELSKASDPMAAWTVAFGSQASETNNRSVQFEIFFSLKSVS